MIALMMFGALLIYILLSIFVVWLSYKIFKTKKALFIALIIMILIPTWDVIIGKPIYNYLCKHKAGVHIYKTVDNVEGFYIGEQRKEWEPHEPYKGYKFVDYKEKESDKYYRSYWIDNNTSKDCVPIGKDFWSKDGKLYSYWFHSGKCIVKKEIPEGEVSRWEMYFGKYEILYKIPILKFKIYRIIKYKDRKSGELMADAIRVWWQGGWVYGILSSIEVGSGGVSCDGNVNLNTLDQKIFKIKK